MEQQLFDTVLNALRKQRRPSIEGGLCQYRASNGDRCAAGHLIPDHLYDRSIEDLPFDELVDVHAGMGLTERQINLILDMQHAHDISLVQEDMSEWERDMKIIADEYELNYKGVGE